MEESDEIVTPLIRHRIKVLSCSLSVINDGAAQRTAGSGSVAKSHQTWKQSRMHLASTERVL
ncbi:hypothetical protein PI125_g25841 [Phytophthora idaei]|nr:hypothetical protein PI125_g25841 [Phytophthora idaei]